MGRVFFGGGKVGMKKPSTGILASDIAVGSAVKLMENGSAVEYLVVHQGNPDSSLYDSSCDGTWLMLKNHAENRVWDSSNNDYANSDIHAFLNNDYITRFDTATKATIKQVKIPYRSGTGIGGLTYDGSNGLSCKVFLPSRMEVGGSASGIFDGATLEYFSDSSMVNERRKWANNWWLRTPIFGVANNAAAMDATSGDFTRGNAVTTQLGVRPIVVLDSATLFDATSLTLKGVA